MMAKPYLVEVEYLESSGTQYIDTGYSFNSDTDTIEVYYQNTSSVTYKWLFGSYETNATIGISCHSLTQTLFAYKGNVMGTQSDQYNSEHVLRYNSSGMSNDGTNLKAFTSYSGTWNLYLFALNNTGSSPNGYYGYGKIWHYVHTRNGVVIRDMIPVLDYSRTPCLYDKVSGQLFYNQGTGDFTYGREIKQVEYIQSSGTQYIDTLWTPKSSNLRAKFKVKSMGSPNQKAICGAEKSYVTPRWVFILYGQNANVNKTFPLTGDWNNSTDGFTFTSGTVLDIDWTTSATSTTITDSISNTTFTKTFGSTINYTNNDVSLKLFCNSTSQKSSIQMNYYQIWDNNVLVRDYIPAIDENNVAFMFDRVTHSVYLNAGTGDFVAGHPLDEKGSPLTLRKKLALMLASIRQQRKYYCEVEYIQSTNRDCYINTGVFPDLATIKLEIRAIKETGFSLFGSYESGKHFNLTGSGNYNYLRYNGGSTPTYAVTDANKPHTFIADKGALYVDGELKVSRETSEGVSINSIALFSRVSGTNNNQYSDTGNHTIYYCKIWNGGKLVRDMIPVLDWSYVPCLYDKITKQLFYNTGTGTLTAGREIHYVDYLEATGTQYINTGLLSTANSKVDITYSFATMASGVANNCAIFGGRSNTTYTVNTFTMFKLAGANPQNFRFDYNGQKNIANASTLTWNTTSIYRMTYNGTRAEVTNLTTDETDGMALAPGESYTSAPIALFAVNTSGAFGQNMLGKIYHYWYTDGTNTVDMYPAIDQNGVGFMFDKESHSCYLNGGSGAFGYPARETEYIEVTDLGTNNQNPCLDLGLKYKSSMSIEAKYTRTAQGVSGSVLPLSNSTTQPLIYMPALNASAKTDRFVWRRPSLPESSYYYDFASYPMTVEFKVDAVNDVLYVNGVSAKTGMITAMNGYTSPYESDSNLYMLSINGTYGGMGKVYYLKLYDTTQTYRNLIPAYKDGNVGMYDKENNVHYTNYKTGTVVMGKVVESKWF